MAKHLGLQQLLVDGRAVELDEGSVPPLRQIMQPSGDELLAGAALADHKHRLGQRRDLRQPLQQVEEGLGLADE